jgi:hypothetical protein
MAIRVWDSTKLVVGKFLVKLGFLALRLVVIIFQAISWRILGIEDVLHESQGKSKPRAQALRILASYKYCFLLPPSLRDFIFVHDEYVDPEYVIRNDHVTLCFLDRGRDAAVFAEIGPEKVLWRSETENFLTLAMFRYAKRLIVMPMAELHRLSAQLPDPKKPLIIMGNTGRSGSTLLTQILECTNHAVAISEPYPLNDLASLYSKHGASPEVLQLTRTLVRMYTKPVKCVPDPVGYLMKPTGPSFICAEIISQIYPDITRTIYLYRDMEKVTKSIYKMSYILPSTRMAYICCRLNGNLVSHVFKQAGFPTEGTNRTVDNDYCSGVFQAAVAGNVYRKMQQSGFKVFGLLFDDLLREKEKGVRAIFKVCGIPESAVSDAMTAFTRDSQRTSIVSMEAMAKIKPLEFTARDKEQSSKLLVEYGYPAIDQPCRLPGTMDFDEVLKS